MKALLFFTIFNFLTLTSSSSYAVKEGHMIEQLRPYAVTLSVENLEETAAWYQQKLGFKQVKAKDYPEFSTSLKFLELNGFRVELIKDGNAKSGAMRQDPPKHTSTWGISQFAFETKDLSNLKKELAARGVPIVWEFENADLGAKFLFIRDPAGNLVQILQRL